MEKELNRELFGERQQTRQTRDNSTGISKPMTEDTTHFLNLDKQMLELRQLAIKTEEFMKTNQLKMEQLTKQMQRLEQSHNGLAVESGRKITNIAQRLTERKIVDQKIQEMVDRHTNIIKTFEVRMHNLQLLLQEKESQYVQSQAALNEAKMEIARLKRL